MAVTPRLKEFLKQGINRFLLISGAFHCLILLLFLLVTIGFEFYPPDFAEVSFVSGEQLLAGTPAPVAASRLSTEVTSQEPAQILPEESKEEEAVRIPNRRMLEDEEPLLRVRESKKRVPSEERVAIPSSREVIAEQPVITPEAERRSRGDKATPGATRISVLEKEIPRQGTGTGGASGEQFKIEGEAAQREILYKVIPEYPAGLQREATVKVSFTVLPDGSVGEMMPVIKGDATLESLTLNALRQWRFNPLSTSAPQKEVKGIITFRYILR